MFPFWSLYTAIYLHLIISLVLHLIYALVDRCLLLDRLNPDHMLTYKLAHCNQKVLLSKVLSRPIGNSAVQHV